MAKKRKQPLAPKSSQAVEKSLGVSSVPPQDAETVLQHAETVTQDAKTVTQDAETVLQDVRGESQHAECHSASHPPYEDYVSQQGLAYGWEPVTLGDCPICASIAHPLVE